LWRLRAAKLTVALFRPKTWREPPARENTKKIRAAVTKLNVHPVLVLRDFSGDFVDRFRVGKDSIHEIFTKPTSVIEQTRRY